MSKSKKVRPFVKKSNPLRTWVAAQSWVRQPPRRDPTWVPDSWVRFCWVLLGSGIGGDVGTSQDHVTPFRTLFKLEKIPRTPKLFGALVNNSWERQPIDLWIAENLCRPENARHRTMIRQILVHPKFCFCTDPGRRTFVWDS